MAHLDLYRLGSLAGEDPALLDDYLTARADRLRGVARRRPSPGFERVAARVRLEHLGGDRRVAIDESQ